MVVLTAAGAQQIRLAKRNVSHETYKYLFESAVQRVRSQAEMDCTDMVFKVPHYVVGRPLFNVKHAARYVSEKLAIYGYATRFYANGDTYFVHVCWRATPVVVPKKPKDVKKQPSTSTDIHVSSGDAVRRLELVKSALRNSLGKK